DHSALKAAQSASSSKRIASALGSREARSAAGRPTAATRIARAPTSGAMASGTNTASGGAMRLAAASSGARALTATSGSRRAAVEKSIGNISAKVARTPLLVSERLDGGNRSVARRIGAAPDLRVGRRRGKARPFPRLRRPPGGRAWPRPSPRARSLARNCDTTPIRVMHLITDLDVGGAEMMLAKLAEAFDRARFRTVVVSLMPPGLLGQRLTAAGIAVHSLGMARGVPDPRGLTRLVSLLRREPVDLLQSWLY